MAKNVYIGESINKIDYSGSSYGEQIGLGELTIALVSIAPSSYDNSITPVWNDSLGKYVFPDGVTTTLVSSGGDWFSYAESNAGYANLVTFAIPTENQTVCYSYEVDDFGVETRGKYTHSFAEDVARKIKSIYIGVDGVARRIKKVYIGDENRLARLCYELSSSYLTFSSPNNFTLAIGDATTHWHGTLEYSTNKNTWTTWDGTTTLSSATTGSKHVLYLRGTGNTVINGENNIGWNLTGSDISCIGNIETLLDYATVESGNHPTMATYCYYYVFYNCTSCAEAPAVPATALASSCYYGMFRDCTALTKAPALPATTLLDHCYYGMFQGCTALTQAPTLPATTLLDYCYQSMFYRCTSLTQAPALPATTLATNCYRNMFYECTSLTQIPSLPAITLAKYCYYQMFSGCSKIKLSKTQTGEYTVAYRIPTTGTGTTASSALTTMFTGTGGTFTGTPTLNTTYYLSNTNSIVS